MIINTQERITYLEEQIKIKDSHIADLAHDVTRLLSIIDSITQKDKCCDEPSYNINRYAKDGTRFVKCANCGNEIEAS